MKARVCAKCNAFERDSLVRAVGWFRKRESTDARLESFREQAQPDVEFTERDRETLTPTESDRPR